MRTFRKEMFLRFLAFIVGVILGQFYLVWAYAQQDPYRDLAPHDVPHCSPKGGPKSALCRCLGMVGDVQTAKTVKCWEDGGFLIARDDQGRPIESLLPTTPPPEVSQCMAKVPDHCEVVAKAPSYWSYKGKNTCRTSCKPENCGCADQACKPHGAGVY